MLVQSCDLLCSVFLVLSLSLPLRVHVPHHTLIALQEKRKSAALAEETREITLRPNLVAHYALKQVWH
jgi:hypothetical protein